MFTRTIHGWCHFKDFNSMQNSGCHGNQKKKAFKKNHVENSWTRGHMFFTGLLRVKRKNPFVWIHSYPLQSQISKMHSLTLTMDLMGYAHPIPYLYGINILETLQIPTLNLYLSYDVASGSEITPCNKIDKPLVIYRFMGNLMTSLTTLRK